jgi:7-alpha-hydroxysteroid dehydrogenase
MFSLHGQVAIVTGAGKGIGRACALAFAQAGADVALAARTRSDLDSVAAGIRAMGRRAINSMPQATASTTSPTGR